MFYDEKSDYKSLLPDIFQGIVEINELDNSVNIQLDKLNTFIKTNIDNKSLAKANKEGISRWEKILSITSPLNLTLQSRKEAVKAKLMSKPPINVMTIKEIIQAYMGLEVDVFVNDFQILIKYRGTSRISDLKPLYQTMYDMIPANMLLNITYLYVVWNELDLQKLTFTQLDNKNLTWNQIERGEWI